jgi:CheY-like chemotaxis protein/pSer/pThr/pTyr-binding forkhead associated (FHA) protein
MPNETNTPWVVELLTPQMHVPIKFEVTDEVIVGRSSAGQQELPDIDLSPYGADNSGVSRRHVALVNEDDRLCIVDLGSNNGTHLDGQRLTPRQAYPLPQEAQLHLGHLPVELKIVTTSSDESSVLLHPEVKMDNQPTVQRGNGELILIVEDDLEVARILARLVEQAGYRPQVTHEVVGAIRAYNRHRPHLILLDLLLPDMNGLEFCRYVRRDVIQNSIPVIVVSGDTSATRDAITAGADTFLRKPFSGHELQQAMALLIQKHQRGELTDQTRQLVGTAPLATVPKASRPYSVVLYLAGFSDEPITVSIEDSISFGRTPSTASLKTHIDLSRFDASQVGVSRLHMFLHRKGRDFFMEDANSTNGTYQNGFSIPPGEMVPVKNGDEIRLGMLRMYIYFLDEGNT